MVAAKAVDPGDEIFYTLDYINSGDDVATNAVMNDPIIKGTIYDKNAGFKGEIYILWRK